jgi:hypothetical protein
MNAPLIRGLARPATGLLLMCMVACAETEWVAPAPAPIGQAAFADDDLWTMVPAEADLVLFADLVKLRESPWTKDSFDKVAPADAASAEPAFDQVRGMDRVIFAKLPSLRDGASVLVAQGKVDRETMGKSFQASGHAERSVYRNAELLVRGEEALAFLGKRTVLSGLALTVRAALDCNAGVARAIDSEPWLRRLRGEIESKGSAKDMVALLYIHLQPATREVLLREIGEGGSIEDFGGRIDLGADLDAAAVGMVGTQMQARDLAARLGERIRELRTRPIIAAFGLGSVLDSLKLASKESSVRASLHVSEKERSDIALRIATVTEIFTKMRAEKAKDDQANQEKQQP